MKMTDDATKTWYQHDAIYSDNPLQLVEDNLIAPAQVSEEKIETETEIKTVYKEKAETKIKVEEEKETQQEKALAIEQKDQNECRSTNIFNSSIDFQCAGT